MEQYFRTAIWIFCLVACLQAKPVQKRAVEVPFDLDDSSFNILKISCDNDVTFKTPKKLDQSLGEALTLFIQELERAGEVCEDKNGDAAQVAENLHDCIPTVLITDKPTEVHQAKQFPEFLEDFKSFLQQLNNKYEGQKCRSS